jgi:excisionase family DNA binding protein
MNGVITTKEAAERLKVSVRRVQALIAAGRLPAEKIGHTFAIKESDLKIVNGRKNGRPTPRREHSLNDWDAVLDRVLGSVALGPRDLSTNKKYMEGFGRENAYSR